MSFGADAEAETKCQSSDLIQSRVDLDSRHHEAYKEPSSLDHPVTCCDRHG